MTKKNIIVHFISCCVLCIEFILSRYVFYELHHMQDCPLFLFLFSLIVIGISFLFKARLVPIVTSLSYIVGFIAGAILQKDVIGAGGQMTNTLWIIWTYIILFAVISSVIVEIIKKKINNW